MRTAEPTRHHATIRRGVPASMLVLLAVTTLAVHAAGAITRATEDTARSSRPLGSVCRFSHRADDDPIVHPGMPGMAHSHDFFGNVSTNAASTDRSLASAASTCRITGDRAAYWLPTLLANGAAVTPDRIHAYYSRKTNGPVAAPPAGLRVIAGGTRASVVFSCMRGKMPTVQRQHPTDCSGGGDFAIGIKFPDCWNGVALDSADHRSHMAYSRDGACPPSHPVAVARLLVFAVYPGVPDGAALQLSSGPLTGAHADFINAWDQTFLTRAVDYCLNQAHNCQKRLPRVLRTTPATRR